MFLAGSPPLELKALLLAAIYKYKGGDESQRKRRRRGRARTDLVRSSEEDLAEIRFGGYTIDAVRLALRH